jgi:hypothetical protein
MRDDEALAVAGAGRLRDPCDPEEIRQSRDRML